MGLHIGYKCKCQQNLAKVLSRKRAKKKGTFIHIHLSQRRGMMRDLRAFTDWRVLPKAIKGLSKVGANVLL